MAAAPLQCGILLEDTDHLHDNHADGADGGGPIETNGNANVLTNTLADNIAELYGGAIDASDQTDISNTLTVTSSTLSGNSGSEAIGQYDRPVALTNVTLAQNTGKSLNLHGSPPLQLANTLLAHNAGGNCATPLAGTLLTSLSTDMTCFLLNGHDGVSLELSPLGNYSGPTLTHMIASVSPAQDHGGFCPATDQRGFPRTGPTAGLACDIGAMERQDGEPFGRVFLPLVKR